MEELLAELAEAPDAEKGDRGCVGVIAGSIDQAGPPALTGKAALRAGSDLVKILTSEEVLPVVAGYSENLIVSRYTGDHLSEDSVSKARDIEAWSDALVIGPGLSEPDQAAVQEIVSAVSIPLVVDADAIEPALTANFSNAVFTPDAKETTHIKDAFGSLEDFAQQTQTVVVSKGATDEIYTGTDVWTNERGTPAMTVGGTGDILAGVIASAIGQGLDRTNAARLGAWTVGAAGERATEAYGNGLMATDIIDEIPRAMAV